MQHLTLKNLLLTLWAGIIAYFLAPLFWYMGMFSGMLNVIFGYVLSIFVGLALCLALKTIKSKSVLAAALFSLLMFVAAVSGSISSLQRQTAVMRLTQQEQQR